MDCLDREVLQLLAEGELPPEETAECEAHLEACADCRALRATVLAGAARADPTGSTGGLESAGASASPVKAPRAQLERGTGVGRYLVLEKLGQGGMGEVYAAFDPQLNRKVALKLLLAQGTQKDATSRERLLREAQAMAQLSHPNVLPVHDAGEFEGRVFIAMELVEGGNLREWVKTSPRPWPEVVRHFLDAGRGLAAAHKAGLVHRDFKPDNVMLGQDGRVYVMDFGLARPGGDRSGSGGAASGSWDTPEGLDSTLAQHTLRATATGLLGTHLTQAGGIIGTPGYMAPEQIRGEGLDARADAFAFCASLYYGLYGHKPFAGRSVREVLQATQEGRVQPPPRDSKVPAWLHRVLLKGLAPEREQRYPTMEALLAAVQDNPAVRVRRYAYVVLGALLLVSAFAVPRYLSGRTRAACEVEAQAFAQTWSPERHRAVEQAFLATKLPYAQTAVDSVKGLLDAYGARWSAQRLEACTATRVRREASQHELALRTECLERRRSEVGALLDVFAQADAKMVEKAVTATSGLSALEPCASLDQLLRQVKPPDSADVAAQVAEARAELTRAKVLLAAGRVEAGLALVKPVVAQAKVLGYTPLEAEALSYLGSFQEEFGQRKEAQRTLRSALAVAESIHHDEVKVRAVLSLSWLYADDMTTADEARQWCDWAIALLSRIPNSDRELSRAYQRYGWTYVRENRPLEAEPYLRKALTLADASAGRDSSESILAINGLGVALTNQQKLTEAKAVYERLEATVTRVWGADHPRMAILYGNLTRLYASLGEEEKALASADRAMSIFRGSLSPKHPNFARLETYAAGPLVALERYPEALTRLRSAVAMYEESLGAKTPELVDPLLGLSTVLVELGRPAEALAHVQRAGVLARSIDGDALVALTDVALAHVYLALRRAPEALPLLQSAVPRLQAQAEVPSGDVGNARYLLARALWDTGKDKPGALRLAQEVHAKLTEPGAAWTRRQVERWLATHANL